MADPELIATTKSLLDPIISKPKLADKLLGKPPFRFLHDVFTNVSAATGFAAGLYGESEMSASSISGKGPKMAYLDKMILAVGIANGSAIDVRSGKIVAGLEPECTNVLLQVVLCRTLFCMFF
jgi:TRAF3-interacting protein 1